MTETTAEAGIPETHTEARLMRHAYDGIHEYDNPLPGWWKAIFYASIAYAAGYGVFYHVGHWGQTPAEKYAAVLATYQGQKEVRDRADAANVSDAILAAKAADPQTVANGRAVFVSRCVTCHNTDGQGLIGPNLTDLFSLHGETRMDVFTTIKRGVPTTAMLAWGEQMSPEDIMAAAAYVITLRGTNVPGKAREGQPVQPFTP
jgi:cytochrome c oxidase cbb3-type subunit 3